MSGKLIKKYIISIVFCFVINSICAQYTIKGTVYSSKKEKIENTLITLEENAIIKKYAYTDENGEYKIAIKSKGEFFLSASALGFSKYIEKILLDEKFIIQKDFFLEEKEYVLSEVIVEVNQPILIKKDTIVFDAKFYSKGTEEVVEDLLKKIPGLNIDQSGTIKVGNQEIEKLMVDGDDLFEKGYKIYSPTNCVYKRNNECIWSRKKIFRF